MLGLLVTAGLRLLVILVDEDLLIARFFFLFHDDLGAIVVKIAVSGHGNRRLGM